MFWLSGFICLVAVSAKQDVQEDCINAPDVAPAMLQIQTQKSRATVISDISEELPTGNEAKMKETREINITIENSSVIEKIGFKILAAMENEKLAMSEWVPVIPGGLAHSQSASPENLTSSKYIADTDTFPKTYSITVQRSDEWSKDTEGFESVEEHDAYETELDKAREQAKELAESDPADNELEAPPASLLTLSVDEARAYLSQVHVERFGALEELNASRVGELPVEVSREAILLAAERAKKKKNSKQLKWAAKAVSKLEAKVCGRKINGKPVARVRRSRAVHCKCGKFNWFETKCHCGCQGWEDIAGICYEHCPSGWIGHWFACHERCGANWEDTGSTCNERCTIHELSHISTTCGLAYCAKDTGACFEKIAKLAVAFLEALANFVPGGKAMSAMKAAAKAGTKAALKKAIKKAVKDVAKRLRRDAKRKLRKYLKKQGRALREELMDSIIDGGVEVAAETMVAKTEGGALKDAAIELVKAVDPTGISGIVSEFEADSCNSKKIHDMPEDGLRDTICPEQVTLSGGENYQPTRMGLFEYMGEDNDERPIYMNPHNQFLYYWSGAWYVGHDTSRNSGGLYANSHDYCPPSSGWVIAANGRWVSHPLQVSGGATWTKYNNYCVSATGVDLRQTRHSQGDASVQACKNECIARSSCSAIEWYDSAWDRSKCKLMLTNPAATKGHSGGRWVDATCHIKP